MIYIQVALEIIGALTVAAACVLAGLYALGAIGVAEYDEGPSLDDLADRIRAFGIATFPTSTPESTAEHLRREVVELLEDPTDGEEQADVFFLLVQLSRVSGTNLSAEVERKLAINLARRWQPPCPITGVVEHVKETA